MNILLASFIPLLAATNLIAEQPKISEIAALDALKAEIVSIAASRTSNEWHADDGQKIRTILTESLSTDHLMKLGIMFYLYACPGRAGEAITDDVLFDASRHCASLIASRAGHDATKSLITMKAVCGPDGGESLFYQELIESQGALKIKR